MAVPPDDNTDSGALIERVEAMRGVRVLCVGDAMIDRFVHGAVDRVSPEAPIPILRVAGESVMPGGAGNVTANLAALGAEAVLVAIAGEDEAGDQLARLLADLGTAEIHLLRAPRHPTTVKTRFTASGQQLLRADREADGPHDDACVQRLLDAARSALDACGAVILSDYGKGVVDAAVAEGIIAAARDAGIPVVVDPKGRDYGRYRGATVVTPNRRELAEASGAPVDGDDAVVAAAGGLIARSGVGALVVTRSEEGMTVVPAAGQPVHLRGEAREVFDVSGAGDTVVATLAAALAAGASLNEAARLANVAGGIVVGKRGTATVRNGELSAACRHQDWARSDTKIVSGPAAARQAARWRQAGLRVGFTNGCFDLLHPGHIALMGQARAACDRLIVGLNSDASVQRLKGPDRPVQAEVARATVLASLAAVDLVVVFAEDTPLALIEAIRPDVLVKGADYTIDRVVGAAEVEAYGGTVMLADLAPGHSTTATIGRLRG
ncbi:MAG: D-glycero-beta-D-manno-heptose-7-phosphate kinase [Inquilinaceae bacterium]